MNKRVASPRHIFLPWIAALLSGILIFCSYVAVYPYLIGWVCLVPVLLALREAGVPKAFGLGWLAGFIGLGAGGYWIVPMLERFAHCSLPMAFFGLLLIAAANGLLTGLWAGTVRHITRTTGWSVIWIAPVVWTALEKFWPQLYSTSIGVLLYERTSLTQIADVTGILGVSFLLVFGNAAIAASLERLFNRKPKAWQPLASLALVLALVTVYGAIRIESIDKAVSTAPGLTLGLIQANSLAEHKNTNRPEFVRIHQELSHTLLAQQSVDLLVWPETLLDVTTREDSAHGRIPSDALGNLNTPLLFGAILRVKDNGPTRYYNSAILVSETGSILGKYNKMQMVPFGEYIPLGNVFPWLYSWSSLTIPYSPGENPDPLQVGNHLIAVTICYEDIQQKITRLIMREKDGRIPDAMINLSDDSWFGNTIEPTQHLALSTFRAIEHRRSLVRSTPTGICAVVDPAGRIVQRTEQWTTATLVARIPMMEGRTVYAKLGDWLGWLCGGLALLGLAWDSRTFFHQLRK